MRFFQLFGIISILTTSIFADEQIEDDPTYSFISSAVEMNDLAIIALFFNDLLNKPDHYSVYLKTAHVEIPPPVLSYYAKIARKPNPGMTEVESDFPKTEFGTFIEKIPWYTDILSMAGASSWINDISGEISRQYELAMAAQTAAPHPTAVTNVVAPTGTATTDAIISGRFIYNNGNIQLNCQKSYNNTISNDTACPFKFQPTTEFITITESTSVTIVDHDAAASESEKALKNSASSDLVIMGHMNKYSALFCGFFGLVFLMMI